MGQTGDHGQRWQDLLRNPREEIAREIKSWLDLSDGNDRANLAKAMLALANTGGGQILIGFEEMNGDWTPKTPRPHPIDHYDQDTVNGIVQRYADPQFHCSVYHVEHPDDGDHYPVIDIPGGHKVPIRARRGGPNGNHVTHNTYYIRRPGPESAPPQTGREWDDLMRRCVTASRDEMLDRIRNVFMGIDTGQSTDRLDQTDDLTDWTDTCISAWEERVEERDGSIDDSLYRDGYWTVSYLLDGPCDEPSRPDLKEILRDVKGAESGWPPWMVHDKYVHPRNGAIEAWMVDNTFDDPAHADYWRAVPEGKLFLLRGFQEDAIDDLTPGTAVDIVLPIWRLGECLLHAKRLARELCEEDPEIGVEVRWTGIQGRQLVSVVNPRRDVWREYRAHQDEVAIRNWFTPDDIEDTLPEAVRSLVEPLYEVFDFFNPTVDIYPEELDRMLGG